MGTDSDDRTLTYIENDVRAHAKDLHELQSLSKETQTALKALIKEQERFVKTIEREFDRRENLIDDHETRIRALEGWKAKTGAYWALFAFGAATLMGVVTNQLLPRMGL